VIRTKKKKGYGQPAQVPRTKKKKEARKVTLGEIQHRETTREYRDTVRKAVKSGDPVEEKTD